MAINEEFKQAQIAEDLAETARSLAHSTRNVPHPFDSWRMLGELAETQRGLAQVYDQLAAWHKRVVDGVHYAGEDDSGDRLNPAVLRVAFALEEAAHKARQVTDELEQARSANGVVRWVDLVAQED